MAAIGAAPCQVFEEPPDFLTEVTKVGGDEKA
jgi:hypothetical protein